MAGSNTEPQATPPEPSAPGAAAGAPPSSHPFVIQPRHDVTLSGSAAKAIEDALAAMLVTPEPTQAAQSAVPAPRSVAAPPSEPLVTFVPPAPYLPPPTRFGAPPPASMQKPTSAPEPDPEPEADSLQAESEPEPAPEPEVIAPSPAPVAAPPRRAARQPDPVPAEDDGEPGDPPVPPPRTPLGEILVPYMAALVAVLALGLAVYLELQSRARDEQISSQIAALKTAINALPSNPTITGSISQPVVQPLDFPTNDGTIDALLALQKRVNALEEAAARAPISTEGLRLPTPLGDNTAAAAAAPLQDGPTKDCIPIDTRFVALPGEPYPICRTPEVVKLSDITGDTVLLDGGTAPIVEGGFQRLGFGGCTLLVISADVEGFAELRVTCG